MRAALASPRSYALVLALAGLASACDVPPEDDLGQASTYQATEEETQQALGWPKFVKDAWNGVKEWVVGSDVPKDTRKRLCEGTGGVLTSVHVTPCLSGIQTITPAGLKPQTSQCAGGNGYSYSGNQCVYKDVNGRYMWHDGPSTPTAADNWLPNFRAADFRYIYMFWASGERHDFCYHHNSITYGFTKAQCDQEFLDHMLWMCSLNYDQDTTVNKWFHRPTCISTAHVMASAVRLKGDDAWNATKTIAHYLDRNRARWTPADWR